jgi:hypothetical protein
MIAIRGTSTGRTDEPVIVMNNFTVLFCNALLAGTVPEDTLLATARTEGGGVSGINFDYR